ncbi:MAG: hypothetical protein UHS41_08245 [Lachnospiraceae bacterium]|nr:hypothetical protein [Lachnospiraceae bacterium]
MFFFSRKKSAEQKANEDKVMWIHEHASYMTYIDEVDVGKSEIHIEGPHVKGLAKEGTKLFALDCNGKELGILKILSWETKKQGTFLGSVNTGEYLIMDGKMVSEEKTDMHQASMLVNDDIFL